MIMNDVKKAIQQVANENNVKLDLNNLSLTLKETGIDSLALLNLIFKVETKLGIRLDDSELIKIKNLQDLIDAFSNKLNK
ncbi:MAG: acyl carrier protein [Ureaplasma sp.]|nr:acyl carrier protein [Ureaplasma sp.]